MTWRVIQGDCLEVIRRGRSGVVDSCVTDPPAGIAFMGKSWDKDKGGRDKWVEWLTEVMREVHRALKPGGHALVWALPRTSHWTATAIEDAGFEIRDVVTHHFGTGFPKSLDVSKAIDKAAGASREVVGEHPSPASRSSMDSAETMGGGWQEAPAVTAPATDDAKRWDGWGTALKPASEHWILARKPLVGTVAANVLEHGTGALNVDGCRIGSGGDKGHWPITQRRHADVTYTLAPVETQQAQGRWPANAVFSGDAAEELDAQSGTNKDGIAVNCNYKDGERRGYNASGYEIAGQKRADQTYGGGGGASRFFYCPKASKRDRGEGNDHPTVKAHELMRWLVRLVTPPGGLVLDPFCGSGSTGVACAVEGFRFVGIEADEHYAEIARRRIKEAQHAEV